MSGTPRMKSARSEPVPATGSRPTSSRGRAGEGKRPSCVLLRKNVELLLPDVPTELNGVAPAVPQSVVGKCMRLVGVSRVRGFGKPATPLEKIRFGGPQLIGSWSLPAIPAA